MGLELVHGPQRCLRNNFNFYRVMTSLCESDTHQLCQWPIVIHDQNAKLAHNLLIQPKVGVRTELGIPSFPRREITALVREAIECFSERIEDGFCGIGLRQNVPGARNLLT
jgi:hypothetical protein